MERSGTVASESSHNFERTLSIEEAREGIVEDRTMGRVGCTASDDVAQRRMAES